MATPGMEKPSERAVNPNYRVATELMTRSGGIVWGIILLFVGILWFAASAHLIDVSLDLVLPFLVVVAGLYLLVTKLMR